MIDSMKSTARKLPARAHGFAGQRMLVLPRPIIDRLLSGYRTPTRQTEFPLPLLTTDVGHFPRAQSHWISRPTGRPELILILCLGGQGWVASSTSVPEHERRLVRTGQLAVIAPNSPHAYGAAHSDPWTISWCHAAGPSTELFSRLLLGSTASNTTNTDMAVFGVADPLRLASCFEALINSLRHGYGADAILHSSGELARLLSLAVRFIRSPNTDAGSLERVRDIVSHLRESPADRYTIATLAERSRLSLSQFNAIFRQITGYPPLDFILRARVQHACSMLATTDRPIKLVAREVGFDDPLYFSRVFRRIQGTSPKDFRTTLRATDRQIA